MAGFGELGSFDDRFALPEPTAAELAQAEQMRAKLAADHYFGNTPRKVLPAGYVESLPDLGPATTFGELSPGVDWANTLFGTGEGERFQMWPERMVRSGLTLPGDIASGAEPLLPPGLRREDYTDAAPPQRGSAEGIFGNRLRIWPACPAAAWCSASSVAARVRPHPSGATFACWAGRCWRIARLQGRRSPHWSASASAR
jgi:hypothetical protein